MRTLYYVPMIHQEWETNSGADPEYSPPTDEQLELREKFQDKYWAYISWQLLENVGSKGLILSRTAIDLDLFREGWTSRRSIERSVESMVRGADIGDPMSSLLISMLTHKVRPNVTENYFAYALEGMLVWAKFRHENLAQYLLNTRDRGIAFNLNKSVKSGGTAVLFIGAAHDVPMYLDSDWEVKVVTTFEVVYILRSLDTKQKRWVNLYLKQSDLTEDDIWNGCLGSAI